MSTLHERAAAVPILDQLLRVPAEARCTHEEKGDFPCLYNIPVGRMAADAAAEIQRLSTALAAAEARIAELGTMRRVELTDAQVRSACLSYRHDYGLMDAKAQSHLEFQCREWCRAISKEFR